MSEINNLSEYALDQTIAAIATPIGSGGIGIVRLSGEQSLAIAARVAHLDDQSILPPRHMTLKNLYDGEGRLIDDALIVYMPGPHSYTGEDVVELQCHGGAQVSAQVLTAVLAAGATLAKPGEFTLRAFLNGRIDLTQAEAVDDLIQAPTPQAASILAEQLNGRLKMALQPIEEQLLNLLAQIEVGADFPDDEDALTAAQALEALEPIVSAIEGLLEGAQEGRILKEGINVCLLGATNVGKSSLLNALLAEDRAIVTQVAGTTRDVIEEYLNLAGLPVILSDTAGLRQATDEVEAIGIKRSRQQAAAAQLILLVLDCSRPLSDEDKLLLGSYSGQRTLILLNKSDLSTGDEQQKFLAKNYPQLPIVILSAKTKQGLNDLEMAIKKMVLGGQVSGQRVGLINNLRHQEALLKAKKCLEQATASLQEGCPVDIVGIDLQAAWQAFGEISGKTAGEEVLAHIFSKFCLGK